MPTARSKKALGEAAPSRGRFANTGNGPTLQVLDIGHRSYMAVVDPDTAFWALVRRNKLAETLGDSPLRREYAKRSRQFAREMDSLRFGLKPSAVYFNPTERCNLNCTYCYIPAAMRKGGLHMSSAKVSDALGRLRDYFKTVVPKGLRPQIVFHGAEPMLNRGALFDAIDAFGKEFRFGVQTNGTLLDDEAISFLTSRDVSIGISLDGASTAVADRNRRTWDGGGVSGAVVDTMRKLRGYSGWSVICTVTKDNMRSLVDVVDFFHANGAPTCMLNIVRCTLEGARRVKPRDGEAAKHFLAALDRTNELYRRTGRKLIVANFANVLIGILAPTARRLMCDISPCGGGRCFFAMAPNGDLFPCSEFIGLREFCGGNLFRDDVDKVLQTPAFVKVTGRKVEDIDPCSRCAIRHFCGSPCPAEAHEMNGGMHRTGAFCEFYEEQVRYAMRLIADEKTDAFLWDGWDRGATETFNLAL